MHGQLHQTVQLDSAINKTDYTGQQGGCRCFSFSMIVKTKDNLIYELFLYKKY